MLLNKFFFEELKEIYSNGTMCHNPKTSLNKGRIILQKNIKNFVKFKGHKLDFRIYTFVERLSPNPIIHFYDGFGRVAVEEFSEKTDSVIFISKKNR